MLYFLIRSAQKLSVKIRSEKNICELILAVMNESDFYCLRSAHEERRNSIFKKQHELA